jgi:hypothetical protein
MSIGNGANMEHERRRRLPSDEGPGTLEAVFALSYAA